MWNGDPPSLPILPTEKIQKLLEENHELLLAIMELQNQGRFSEIAQFQARLQNNLMFLAKLADDDAQAKMLSQGQDLQQSHVAMSQQQQWQGMQPQPHVAMSQQQGQGMQPQSHVAMSQLQQGQGMQPQPHVAMSRQQPDHATLTLPMVGMNDEQQQQQQEQQHLAIPQQKSGLLPSNQPFQMNEQQQNLQAFFRKQLQRVPRTSESMYQASQIRLDSMTDAPPSNHFGSGMGPSWS